MRSNSEDYAFICLSLLIKRKRRKILINNKLENFLPFILRLGSHSSPDETEWVKAMGGRTGAQLNDSDKRIKPRPDIADQKSVTTFQVIFFQIKIQSNDFGAFNCCNYSTLEWCNLNVVHCSCLVRLVLDN